MKKFHQHPIYGEIVYTESFWTGRKTITVNGHTQSVSKKEFMIDEKKAVVKGNFIKGVSLFIEGETIELLRETKWYEYLLAILPLVFLFTWGNSPTLCAIFPVIGGGIGGIIGALALCVSLACMKKTKSLAARIFIGIGIFIATILIAFILALLAVLLFVL